jgi:hypothetical protein
LRTIGTEASYKLRPTRRWETDNGTGKGYGRQALLNFPVVLSERHFCWRQGKHKFFAWSFLKIKCNNMTYFVFIMPVL